MDPITIGAITAPLVGGALSYLGGQSANASNQQIAQQQMAFQAQQSGSVYQRGVADLRAAGLNPILAAGGAPDPAAGGAALQMQNPALGLPGATASFSQAAMSSIPMASEITKTLADAGASEASKVQALASAAKINAETGNVSTAKAAMEASALAARASARLSGLQADEAGPAAALGKIFTPTIDPGRGVDRLRSAGSKIFQGISDTRSYPDF